MWWKIRKDATLDVSSFLAPGPGLLGVCSSGQGVGSGRPSSCSGWAGQEFHLLGVRFLLSKTTRTRLSASGLPRSVLLRVTGLPHTRPSRPGGCPAPS